jgi:hypothetical protein
MVQECHYIEKTAAAASVAFPFSTYEVRFDEPIEHVEAPETITVVRKRKEKVLNVSEFLVQPFELEGDTATFTLEAKPSGSLRPDVLLKHCEIAAEILSITRVEQSETF